LVSLKPLVEVHNLVLEQSCLVAGHQTLEAADLEEVAGEEESDQEAAYVVEAYVVACPCVGTVVVGVEGSVEVGVPEVAYDQEVAGVLEVACAVVESLVAGRESWTCQEGPGICPCPYPCPCSFSSSSPFSHSMKQLISSGYGFVDHVCHHACHHSARPVGKACQEVACQGTYQAVVACQAGTFQAEAYQGVAYQVEVQALEFQAMVEVEHLVAMVEVVADQRLQQVLLSGYFLQSHALACLET
jgi:hypothetical protein